MDLILSALRFVFESAIDVLPIAIFLFAFQRLVIGKPLANRRKILVGFAFVVVGLGLFLVGLEKTLFPLGKLMAQQLTDPAFMYEAAGKLAADLVWQDYYWVYIFALAIGFSTTLAEPALIAVSIKANTVSGGAIGIWGLRVAVAIGVGVGVTGKRPGGWNVCGLAWALPSKSLHELSEVPDTPETRNAKSSRFVACRRASS